MLAYRWQSGEFGSRQATARAALGHLPHRSKDALYNRITVLQMMASQDADGLHGESDSGDDGGQALAGERVRCGTGFYWTEEEDDALRGLASRCVYCDFLVACSAL